MEKRLTAIHRRLEKFLKRITQGKYVEMTPELFSTDYIGKSIPRELLKPEEVDESSLPLLFLFGEAASFQHNCSLVRLLANSSSVFPVKGAVKKAYLER